MLDLNEKRSIFFWCCRSRKGAWIEMHVESCVYYDLPCRSRKGAWIEIIRAFISSARCRRVAPARERGLKSCHRLLNLSCNRSLPQGSVDWNPNFIIINHYYPVAPARERGLKFLCCKPITINNGRSRKWAWIEINWCALLCWYAHVAPARERGLKYAYNEPPIGESVVAPARERGLKCSKWANKNGTANVAPARERGLKSSDSQYIDHKEDVAPARERGLK